MLRFCYLLRSRARVVRERKLHIDKHLIAWKPGEDERRRLYKDDKERRRQLREVQLAEEKALSAVHELQKHLKSWASGSGIQILEDLATNTDSTYSELNRTACRSCFGITVTNLSRFTSTHTLFITQKILLRNVKWSML